MLMPEDIASYRIVKAPHQSMQTQLSYQHDGHIDRQTTYVPSIYIYIYI